MHLTERMQAVCDLIKYSKTVCDVGCDHGFVPIYLVKERAFTAALAMDINEGPLAAAGINIVSLGTLEGPKPELRVLTFKLENGTEDQVRAIMEPVSKSLDIRTV